MSTAKEKAKKLIEKMMLYSFESKKLDNQNIHYTIKNEVEKEQAIRCSIIAVDEIIFQWEYIDTYLADGNGKLNPNLKYWYEVKKEIEKL